MLSLTVAAAKAVNASRIEDLNEFVSKCDVVTVNCPLHEGTRGLVNAELLKHFKKGAWLVNTARGAICDKDAVAEALKSGQINGMFCFSCRPAWSADVSLCDREQATPETCGTSSRRPRTTPGARCTTRSGAETAWSRTTRARRSMRSSATPQGPSPSSRTTSRALRRNRRTSLSALGSTRLRRTASAEWVLSRFADLGCESMYYSIVSVYCNKMVLPVLLHVVLYMIDARMKQLCEQHVRHFGHRARAISLE